MAAVAFVPTTSPIPATDRMGTPLPGSFRDPAGHVYISGNVVYRRIEPAGREAYERLMQSGLT